MSRVADHREHPDAEREQRRDHAAEHDDERDERERRGEQLGPLEVVLGLLADLPRDLGPPGDRGRQQRRSSSCTPPRAASATSTFSSRPPCTDPKTRAWLAVVALERGRGSRPSTTTPRRCPARRPAASVIVEPCGPDRRVVDVAVASGDEHDEVGLPGVGEPLAAISTRRCGPTPTPGPPCPPTVSSSGPRRRRARRGAGRAPPRR